MGIILNFKIYLHGDVAPYNSFYNLGGDKVIVVWGSERLNFDAVRRIWMSSERQ